MSNESNVVERVAIPGMQITFQSPLSPDGKGLNFVIACESTIASGDLDQRLDLIAAAVRRQQAVEELPIVKQSLSANLKLLKTAKKEQATAVARHEAKAATRNKGLRNQVELPASDLVQHDNRILQIEGQIAGAQTRIPYLEALIEGREPPELFPVSAKDQAEAAD